MKKNSILSAALLLFIITTVSSCQAIGDIFKAGVWIGVLIVVVIVGIILWLVGKAKS